MVALRLQQSLAIRAAGVDRQQHVDLAAVEAASTSGQMPGSVRSADGAVRCLCAESGRNSAGNGMQRADREPEVGRGGVGSAG